MLIRSKSEGYGHYHRTAYSRHNTRNRHDHARKTSNHSDSLVKKKSLKRSIFWKFYSLGDISVSSGEHAAPPDSPPKPVNATEPQYFPVTLAVCFRLKDN